MKKEDEWVLFILFLIVFAFLFILFSSFDNDSLQLKDTMDERPFESTVFENEDFN